MPICVKCERGISLDDPEFREWIWREDGAGDVVGVICPGCQTWEDRVEVERFLWLVREMDRREREG